MTCYIDKRNYVREEQTRLEPFTFLQPNCMSTLPLRWFASIIQMYSRLCPWLLTWSDYEEGYEDDGEEVDDAGAN
jgi:hypothetical protein